MLRAKAAIWPRTKKRRACLLDGEALAAVIVPRATLLPSIQLPVPLI